MAIFVTIALTAPAVAVVLKPAPALAAPAATERISVSSSEVEGNGLSQLSAFYVANDDGQFVAFVSAATNLVSGDTNGVNDVFVRDRAAGTTERVSISTGGTEGNAVSDTPAISGDGRYVVFTSTANNLVSGDTNGQRDVFLRDRQAGTTERVSLTNAGAQANSVSANGTVSDDGNRVAFSSIATNLVSGDVNGLQDNFVRDREGPTTERASLTNGGAEANGASIGILSGDGRHVAITSVATNLVSGDTNGLQDVFVRDLAGNSDLSVSVAESATSVSLGAIDDGDNATITIVIRPAATGTITATATVSGDQIDNTSGNNTDDESTTVDNGLGCTITGTNAGETINGTGGNDVICGLGGDDIIDGKGGNDTIYGGAGEGEIFGDTGTDTIYGGPDGDSIAGGNGGDTLYGEGGDDNNKGETLFDALLGLFDNGADTIYGGPGDDTLSGQNGDDTLIDEDGADSLAGNIGNDTIDVQDGVSGDTADGGLGSDTCSADGGDTTISC